MALLACAREAACLGQQRHEEKLPLLALRPRLDKLAKSQKKKPTRSAAMGSAASAWAQLRACCLHSLARAAKARRELRLLLVVTNASRSSCLWQQAHHAVFVVHNSLSPVYASCWQNLRSSNPTRLQLCDERALHEQLLPNVPWLGPVRFRRPMSKAMLLPVQNFNKKNQDKK